MMNEKTDAGSAPLERVVRPWPLGICRDMDAHAARQGLAHWSATSPMSNEWWIRRDGLPHRCKWDKTGGYPAELHALDIAEPPRHWVFGA